MCTVFHGVFSVTPVRLATTNLTKHYPHAHTGKVCNVAVGTILCKLRLIGGMLGSLHQFYQYPERGR